MSYRRLWVLIKRLPADSWTQTALRDADFENLDELTAPEPEPDRKFGPWSLANYQIAALRDDIARLTFVLARVMGQKDWPEPEPTPRPGLRPRSARPNRQLAEAQVLYLNKIRARG